MVNESSIGVSEVLRLATRRGLLPWTTMISETMYVLAVPDLARSAEFYSRVLGFEVRETGDPGWRMFVKDGCRIMAGECPDAIPPRDLGNLLRIPRG
jgi:catechol-2,3-dioxygenase